MKDFLDRKLQMQKKSTGIKVKKPKGVGVLGLDEGRTLLLGLNRAYHARPVAGCDVDQNKIDRVEKEMPGIFYTTDFREMLTMKELDIVAIYTPDSQHGDQIVAAFEAGKDVICAKPLTNSTSDALRISSVARETDCRLMVGQSTRFFEPFQRQRADFERGELGDLEFVDAHYIHRMDWYYEKNEGIIAETDWIFLGLSHPVDLLRWYLGPIEEVHAYGFRSELGKQHKIKGNDIFTVNFKAKSGNLGRIFGHYGLQELPSARNTIELMLYGTKKTSQAQYHDMKYRYSTDDGTEICEDPLYAYRHYYFNSEVHGMHYGEFANYTDYFAHALIHNKPYSPDLKEGIETFCIMEAIRRSAQTQASLLVSEVFREFWMI